MQYNHELDRFRITSKDALRNCIYGGHGTVCLVSPSSKAHTYRFNKPLNRDDFPDDVYFVYVLHETKYFYIGMIERNKFRLTKNSRFGEDTESVKGAKYLMQMSSDDAFFTKSPMKVFHSGRCAICGRRMRSKKSIENGVGPKCLRRLQDKLSAEQS